MGHRVHSSDRIQILTEQHLINTFTLSIPLQNAIEDLFQSANIVFIDPHAKHASQDEGHMERAVPHDVVGGVGVVTPVIDSRGLSSSED
jgi:hypothetical protein